MKKRIIKKITALFVAGLMVLSTVNPVMAENVTEINWGDSSQSSQEETPTIVVGGSESDTAPAAVQTQSKPYLALGQDLSPEQLATVLSLMGLAGQDLSTFNIVYITNAMEHQYLDQYVDSSVIGTRALSSVLVRQAAEGHGVQVSTQNINYCTVGMYRNALLTAGVKDADIMVVGPTSISGTAALIGALKAYEDMTGNSVTETAIDTALDELVTTGEISEALGDSEQISELIAFVKAELAGKDLNTEEEIDEAVREAAEKYGANLTEEEIKKIVDLMLKIKDLGLDYNTLLEQAEDLYSKFGTDFSAEDLEEMTQGGTAVIIRKTVGKFFTNMFEKITGFFKGLLGK